MWCVRNMNESFKPARGCVAWCLYIIALCLWFIPPRILAHLGFQTNDYDFGIYVNLVDNLAAGHGFHSSVLGLNHLGEHFSPIVAIFIPAAWCGVTPWALLIAQGLCAVITIALLTMYAQVELAALPERSRRVGLCVLIGLFLFYRPFIAAWDFQFQPMVLGMPLVAAALVAMQRNRWRWLWILVPLLLMTRESAGLSLLGLAIVAGLRYRRPRMALTLVVAGIVVPLVVIGWVMPHFRVGEWVGHAERVGPLVDLPGKGLYLARLLGPLGLFPLGGWVEALAALPGMLLNMAVGFGKQYSADKHYDAQLAVFLMAAAVQGFQGLEKKRADFPRVGKIALAAALAVALLSQIQWQSSHPIRRYIKYWPTSENAAIRRALVPLAQLPESYTLSADPALGPHVCERLGYRTLFGGLDAAQLVPGQLIVVRRDDTGVARLLAAGKVSMVAQTSELWLVAETNLTDAVSLREVLTRDGWSNP